MSLFWQEENDSSAFDELGRLGENMELLPDENTAITRRERTKTINKNEEPSKEKREQYATRGKRHSYCEAEVPDDDHYICKLKNEVLRCLVKGGRGGGHNLYQ